MKSNKRLLGARRPRPSVVVTFGAALVGAAAACGGSVDIQNPPGGDGGTSDSGNPVGCPTTAPTTGTCSVPDGTTCHYGGGCYPATYTCSGGSWAHAISNPPAPQCPTSLPTAASSCDVCTYPSSLNCSYVIAMCNNQPVNGQAQCVAGKWEIVGGGSCNPPPPDAGLLDSSFVDASSTDARHD